MCWAAFTRRCCCWSTAQFCFLQGVQKIPLHLRQPFANNGLAGDQHQVHRLRQLMLVAPEHLAQQPPRPVARDRRAQAAAADHAQPRPRTARQRPPVGHQTARRQTPALRPHAGKFPVLTNPHRAPEPQPQWASGGHHSSPLDRGQPLAPHAPPIPEDAATALGRVAAQEPMLAFAPDFRWLILSLHKKISALARLARRVPSQHRRETLRNRNPRQYQSRPKCQAGQKTEKWRNGCPSRCWRRNPWRASAESRSAPFGFSRQPFPPIFWAGGMVCGGT